jgi:hypothetical protein
MLEFIADGLLEGKTRSLGARCCRRLAVSEAVEVGEVVEVVVGEGVVVVKLVTGAALACVTGVAPACISKRIAARHHLHIFVRSHAITVTSSPTTGGLRVPKLTTAGGRLSTAAEWGKREERVCGVLIMVYYLIILSFLFRLNGPTDQQTNVPTYQQTNEQANKPTPLLRRKKSVTQNGRSLWSVV